MNGKRAKQLRRLAESQTVGQPNKAYNSSLPTPGGYQLTDCTRKTYKRLKNSYTSGGSV